MVSNLSELTLVPASAEQMTEMLERICAEWTPSVPVEVFLEAERGRLGASFGQSAQGWVLCPAGDTATTDFFASCVTYRRGALVALPATDTDEAGSRVVRSVAYSVSVVLTPPRHRRKGYAERMLTLLHAKLAIDKTAAIKEHAIADTVERGWVPNDGHLSVLYSAIGDYYARCGPTPWIIQGTEKTTIWTVADLPAIAAEGVERVVAITSDDFATSVEKDLAALRHDLETADATQTPRFVIEPSAGLYEWHLMRAMAFYGLLQLDTPDAWGYSIPQTGSEQAAGSSPSLIMFTIDPKQGDHQPGELRILRLRANTPAEGAALVRAVLRLARSRDEVDIISAWNAPTEVLQLLDGEGLAGTTAPRALHLSAVAWYGPFAEAPEGRLAQWESNEAYASC